MKDADSLSRKTVRDFGVQWTHHPSNDGFYGSKELFADIVEPLLNMVTDCDNSDKNSSATTVPFIDKSSFLI